jgi:apolipoprotein N-acyltransferase
MTAPTRVAHHFVSVRARPSLSPLLLLIVGVVLIAFTFMRYSVPALAWVAFAPFLLVLNERGTLGRHLAVLGALVIAMLIAVSKMATAGISWIPTVPMFAIPMALSYFVAVAVASMVHRRLGVRWGIYTFAAAVTALTWIQYSFTPGSSWGALAHTQLENLPLIQLAALTGIGGLTFLVALGSGLAAAAWSRGVRAIRWDLVLFGLLLGITVLYGELRLARPAPEPSVLVGSVVSPVTHDEFNGALANVDTLRRFDDELFTRSARAADHGAKVIVWNELATFVSRASEPAFVARGQTFAKERGAMLVMAYGVVESLQPFHDINKYRIYLPDGTMGDEYLKRYPVPGDPDEVGRSHARVVSFGGVNFAGGICYDYGFPNIARDNAVDGADLAVVPSSDWRGIDPEHGQMAIMNAVAVGLPMVRPVRAATSFATDQYGRVLGSLRADGLSDGVMVVAVPGKRVPTLYARTGEIVPLLALAFSVLAVLLAVVSPGRRSARDD